MAGLRGWFAQHGAELANTPQQGALGSLGALGGGQQPPMTGIDWDQHPIGSRPGEPGFDPNKGFNQILYPGGQLPPGWQPNTGGMNPNTPQPVPGMPPKRFDPSQMGPETQTPYVPLDSPRYQPGGDLYLDPSRSSEGPGGITGHAQDPNYWQLGQVGGGPYTNRGSGQPLNQPMGSLQSLGMNPASVGHVAQGAAQLGQMVNLRGPDGSMKAVPQSDLAHWLSKGAVRF